MANNARQTSILNVTLNNRQWSNIHSIQHNGISFTTISKTSLNWASVVKDE